MKLRLFRWLWRFFTKPFRVIIGKMKKIYFNLKERVNQNIRWELIVVFGICLSAAFIVFTFTNSYFSRTSTYSVINYSNSIRQMLERASNIGSQLDAQKISINDSSKIENIVNSYNESRYKILITDLSGKVLYKTSNADETQVDIHTVIKNATTFKYDFYEYKDYNQNGKNLGEFISFYPVDFNDNRAYVIVKGIPEGEIQTRYNQQEKSFFALLLSVVFFIFLFYFIAGRKVRYIQDIAIGVMYMAKGELKYRIDKNGEDELAHLADNINFMADELNNKIERERELEKTKGELITNVSHDLRTPLTSILGYLNLIKDRKFENEEQMMEYINIAYNKSEKLKVLIEELFEYTKLSGGGIKLNVSDITLNGLLEQLIEEFVPIFEENNTFVTKDMVADDIIVEADGDKLVRVFENLIMNAIRYSYKPGEIKIGLNKKDGYGIFYIKNKGKSIPKEDLSKLFDRFYRVEKSRSESTGGSGLGLAISKNIVKLHGGDIWAECEGDEITFYVKLISK
ncbi:sensor histidine kinase [Clostridium lundense]|uniref:sensor histidine kinase n=1 Tax=Clostridium lundense TaxID=319475 RepID=UPI000483450F|nr:HAMP domain-containing sensor histidine kinase [Clostridium lundense]